MNCASCGHQSPDQAAFCSMCGASIARYSVPPRPAGFWLRVAAVLIDMALTAPIYFSLKDFFLTPSAADRRRLALFLTRATEVDRQQSLMLMWEWAAHFAMVVALVCAVYYIALECSPLQGTLGKHVLGIQVTDLNGRRLTFSRALSRFLLRFASALPLYLGFVMAAVGTRKQALHDVIVGTLVVRREPTESLPAVPGHFWRRVAASLIDGFLVMMVLVYPLRAVSPAGNQATVRAISGFVHNQLSDAEYDALVRTAQVTSALSLGILFAGFGLYFVLLEISPLEATLGKRWLGIRVADLDGRRLTLGRATARYVSRWLAAGIWQVGFLMAAFTPRSQGLHDILAGTAVFRR